MGRRSRTRRTPTQARADEYADRLSLRLGRMLKYARLRQRQPQREAARRAGLSQGTWSGLESDGDGRVTIATWCRAAAAVGTTLDAYLKASSATTSPRDAVHLRNEELLITVALRGGWAARPEAPVDRDARVSRFGDVVLSRGREVALVEIWDWLEDVGAALRDFDRRIASLDRYAVARMGGDEVPRTGGCWILRATRRNRELVSRHRMTFRSRFPGSAFAWMAAFTGRAAAMPAQAGLLWASVRGDRLFPARLG